MKRFVLLSLIFAFCQPVVAQRLSTLEFQKFQFDDDTNIAVRVFITDAGENVTNTLPFHLSDRERAKFTVDTNGNQVVRVIPTGGNFVQTQALNAVQADADANTLSIVGANSDIDANENRIIQIGISAARDNALTTYEMDDSFVDGFTDEDGIETTSGSNFTFNAGNNTYEIEGGLFRDFTTNLVALWKCNDDAANTTVTDSSGAGNTGVASVNTDTLSAAGKINDAFFLSRASTERFTASSFDEAWHEAFGTASRSMMYWWREIDWTPGVGSSFHRSEFGSSPFAPIIILGSVFSGNLTFRIRDDDGDTAQVTSSANTGFTDDTWHHFAVSWDSVTDTLTVWIDGVLEGSATNTSIDIFLRYAAAQTFTIGARNRDGVTFDEGADGGVDAIYLFERTLFQGDVTANFNQGNGTEETSLTIGGNAEIFSITNFHFADSVPTESRVLLFLEEVDSITLNTDVVMFSSRDNGTNFTSVVLSEIGTIAGSNILVLSGTNSLTSQLSGTNMVLRAETFNDKAMNFKGWGLLYK